MAALIFVFIITIAVFAQRLAATTAELRGSDETRAKILRDLEVRLENRGVDVYVDTDAGLLRLSERGIRFPSGDVHPKKEHEANVGKLARVLSEVLPCYAGGIRLGNSEEARGARYPWCEIGGRQGYQCDSAAYPAKVETILIEGHTDAQSVAAGSRPRNNLDLSAMRAAEVFKMMLDCEPELALLRNKQVEPILSVSGYGKLRPLDKANELSEKNRRIDLRFLMERPEKEDYEAEPVRRVREQLER
jgi:chemotaxis protein MotB